MRSPRRWIQTLLDGTGRPRYRSGEPTMMMLTKVHCAAVFANKDFVEGFVSKFRPLLMTQEVKLLHESSIRKSASRRSRRAGRTRSSSGTSRPIRAQSINSYICGSSSREGVGWNDFDCDG